tara:strand:+ start:5502 stop:5894 length:393 start_codon:yes stop_codon:yes gene_type:complete
MSITNNEKNRRAGKKAHEQLDNAIATKMEDPDMIAGMLDWLAENDPKRFFDTVMARMPKVQQIDQDLQKTYISLKAMMENLPDEKDIITSLHKWKKKAQSLAYDGSQKDIEITGLRNSLTKAQDKLKAYK